jgi:hypothetical protein
MKGFSTHKMVVLRIKDMSATRYKKLITGGLLKAVFNYLPDCQIRSFRRIIGIALLKVTILSSISVAQVTWHKITDQEAGFTVSFPGQPTYQESTAPETGLPLNQSL